MPLPACHCRIGFFYCNVWQKFFSISAARKKYRSRLIFVSAIQFAYLGLFQYDILMFQWVIAPLDCYHGKSSKGCGFWPKIWLYTAQYHEAGAIEFIEAEWCIYVSVTVASKHLQGPHRESPKGMSKLSDTLIDGHLGQLRYQSRKKNHI